MTVFHITCVIDGAQPHHSTAREPTNLDAALLTSTHANTLPVTIASQTGSQGINWWSMAALSFAAILPLIVIGIVLERYPSRA